MCPRPATFPITCVSKGHSLEVNHGPSEVGSRMHRKPHEFWRLVSLGSSDSLEHQLSQILNHIGVALHITIRLYKSFISLCIKLIFPVEHNPRNDVH